MKKNTFVVRENRAEMQKFIVEAPRPQNGQKASSGGIRENGRLASQYKNPVPYYETTTESYDIKSVLIQGIKKWISENSDDIIRVIMDDILWPLITSGAKSIKNKLFVDTQPVLYVDAIDVPYEAVQDSDTNEIETDNDKTSSGKIIKFATNKAS